MAKIPTFDLQPIQIEWTDTKAVERHEGYNEAAKHLGLQGSSLRTALSMHGGEHTFTIRMPGAKPRVATVTKLQLNKTAAREREQSDPNREVTEAELKAYGSHSAARANRNVDEKQWVKDYREQVAARRKAMNYTPPTKAQRKAAVAKIEALCREYPNLRDELPSLIVEGNVHPTEQARRDTLAGRTPAPPEVAPSKHVEPRAEVLHPTEIARRRVMAEARQKRDK